MEEIWLVIKVIYLLYFCFILFIIHISSPKIFYLNSTCAFDFPNWLLFFYVGSLEHEFWLWLMNSIFLEFHVLIETYQNCCHIIRAYSIFSIWGQDFTKHLFNWLCSFEFVIQINIVNLFSKSFYTLLIVQTVPYAIARKHYKLILNSPISNSNIWKCSYCG